MTDIEALRAEIEEAKRMAAAAKGEAEEAKRIAAEASGEAKEAKRMAAEALGLLGAVKPKAPGNPVPKANPPLVRLKEKLDQLEKDGKTADEEYRTTLDEARVAAKGDFVEIRNLDLRRAANIPTG
jgi:hypothetical protein